MKNNFECCYISFGGTYCINSAEEIDMGNNLCDTCEMNNNCDDYCVWKRLNNFNNCEECELKK